MARTPTRKQPPVRERAECPVPSLGVFLHRFPLYTRETSAKKKTTAAATAKREEGSGGVRFTWTVMYVSTVAVVRCSPLGSLLAKLRSSKCVCAHRT